MGNNDNFILNVNKPSGMSSSQVVCKVKKILNVNKIGHLGTLDPLGTGVLVLAVNKATKLFQFMGDKKKTYRAIFKFGIETDTFDSEGKITKSENVVIEEKSIREVLSSFVGKFDQLPPKFSAKKINGKKACDLARQNIDFELKTRKIEIFKFDLIKKIEFNTYLFEIICSEGTYIRSLCRDLALRLNTCGVMVAILRIKCGNMLIKNARTIEEIQNNEYNKYPISEMIDLPKCEIDDIFFDDLLSGRIIRIRKNLSNFFLYCKKRLFGVYNTDDDGLLHKVADFL